MKGCPNEELLSIYADGELAPKERAALESHLVKCPDCLGQALALKREVSMLAELLQERGRPPASSLPPRERVRGLTVGLAPALGAVALLVVAGGWLLEAGLPAGLGWLNPLGWVGLYDLVFDVLFALRERGRELLEAGATAGTLFSLAALLGFLAGALLRRPAGGGLALVAALGLLAPAEAGAFELRRDEESVVIAAGETIESTLLVAADSVRVDGVIEGDLYAVGDRVSITGRVAGNVFVAAEDMQLTGRIDDTLHVAGRHVRIEGEAEDLYAFAETIDVDERARVARDTTIFAERVLAEGATGRDLTIFGDSLELRARVGRDLVTRSERVALLDGTSVQRNFHFRLPEGESAEVAAGVRIGGERIAGVRESHRAEESRWRTTGFYVRSLVMIISMFLVGMALHALRPGIFHSALPSARAFFRELGLGFATVVLLPVLIVMCFVTVVGIPIGVIGLFGLVTGLFVAVILIAALVGRALLGDDESPRRFGSALLLGLVLLTVVLNLPFVGGLLTLIVVLTGLGMLVAHVWDSYRLWSA